MTTFARLTHRPDRARRVARRNERAFRRAYDQASPSMQSELLALSQRQSLGR